MNNSGKLNQKGKGSKSNNYETNTKTEDLVLAETAYMIPETQTSIEDLSEMEIKNAIVLENGTTSIDFMMPEEERKILEQSLNKYSDMKELRNVLNVAKQNKKLSEDIETLNQISKADTLINNIFDIMNNPENLQKINEYIQQKLAEGADVGKVYKEIGLMNKAMMDAREGMINRLGTSNSGKRTRIALKFTNDDGQDFQLGAEF